MTSPPLAALALGALGLAAGCAPPSGDPAPLDRFVHPTSMAVHGGKLLVLSTNLELAYDTGSLVAVELASDPARFAGGLTIGSFGGDLAVADADACGLAASQVLVASRAERRVLYRIDLDASGLPTCGSGCEVALDDGPLDPYGLAVSCPAEGPARAWVGYLGSADGGDAGHLTEVDLATGARRTVEVASAAWTRGIAYDASGDRVFFTAGLTGASAPLGWISLGGGCAFGEPEWEGGCPIRSRDLTELVEGIDLAGFALSNAQAGLARRVYVAARAYDTDLLAATGERPDGDIGGLLLVLELEERGGGELGVSLVRFVPVGLGASEVRVLPPRRGKRDLVAVTAFRDEVLTIYDDEAGAIQRVFTRDPGTGASMLGDEPFGLVVASKDGSTARVYVASFGEDFVSAVDVPLEAPWHAALVHEGDDPARPVLRIAGAAP